MKFCVYHKKNDNEKFSNFMIHEFPGTSVVARIVPNELLRGIRISGMSGTLCVVVESSYSLIRASRIPMNELQGGGGADHIPVVHNYSSITL